MLIYSYIKLERRAPFGALFHSTIGSVRGAGGVPTKGNFGGVSQQISCSNQNVECVMGGVSIIAQ